MNLETLHQCSVCHSSSISDYLNCTDHFVSGEAFSLCKCDECGFVFTNPRPALSDIAPYYESDEYVSHSKTSAGLINRLFHLSRYYTLSHKKRILRRFSKGNKLLDYGCGTGDFLEIMRRSGWNCFGIEPNSQAREKANQKKGLKITDETELSSYEGETFHSISMWHVLEHVYPLEERLKTFHHILKEEGMLFVAVPNMLSFDAQKYGRYWAAWDVPRHVHHFSPSSIKQLFENSGFEYVNSKPLLLDAFYISMLSEKYKHGKSNVFQAGINGLRSNLKAYFGNRNYSSLIYIFKKSD